MCVALFVYLDFTMSRVHSTSAQIDADTFTVGVDYSGIMEKQYVNEGDQIKKGDPLFELRSPTLAKAIEDDETAKALLLYTLTDDGKILITAAGDGKVLALNYRVGAFVPANTQIATVAIEDLLFVSASYTLSSPDYARISDNSRMSISLPDGKKIDGAVYDVLLQKKNDEVQTTIKARVNKDSVNTVVFSAGTPVETTLYLNNDTWYKRIMDIFSPLFKPGENR